MEITISLSYFPSTIVMATASAIIILFLAKFLFFKQKKIWDGLKRRIREFLWLILPKKIEEFGEIKIKYIVVPGFLIDNSLGQVTYREKTDKVMIFIKSYKCDERYTIFHEYVEGMIFQTHRSSKQVTEMALGMLQLPSNTVERIINLKRDGKLLADKLIAATGEPEKARKLIEKTSPEVLLMAQIVLYGFINVERFAHAFARLATLEVAKRELSPEDFASMLYGEFRIET